MKIDACVPLKLERAFETPEIRKGAKIDFFRDPLTHNTQIANSLAVWSGPGPFPGPFFA